MNKLLTFLAVILLCASCANNSASKQERGFNSSTSQNTIGDDYGNVSEDQYYYGTQGDDFYHFR